MTCVSDINPQTEVKSSGSGFLEQITRLSEEEAIAQGYTVIKTAQDLDNIRNNLSGKYILMNDIDLSSYSNWDPIGSVDKNFRGILDGNGYIVSNLTINRENEDNVGLLGLATGAEIKNLGLENVDVSGNSHTGGLVGLHTGNITNCFVSGSISGQENVGGLAGTGSNFTSCYATGDVSGYSNVGGLVGSESGFISGSYASNTVTGINKNIGGLVGKAESHVILNCYTDGVVNSTGMYTGGITGSGGEIRNSFTLASVTGDVFTGGISGAALVISNCYAAGKVSGRNSGAIAGTNMMEIKDCIFDKEKTEISKPIGNNNATSSNVQGFSSSEMQNPTNWSGWDANIWDFSTYPPKLKWQEPLKVPIDPTPPPDPDQPGGGTDPDNPDGGGTGGTDTGKTPPVGALRLQIGADSTGSSAIYVDTEFDLGEFEVDFTSADTCASAIEDIDEALSEINRKRAEFGAVINRINTILTTQTIVINRINTILTTQTITIQNYSASKSTIMDADIATESAEYVKNQILQQTSTTLLAQSENLHSSIIMSLIS